MSSEEHGMRQLVFFESEKAQYKKRVEVKELLTSVLELLMVDADFDGYTSIDKANEGGGHTNEVGASSVRCTCVAANVADQSTADDCIMTPRARQAQSQRGEQHCRLKSI